MFKQELTEKPPLHLLAIVMASGVLALMVEIGGVEEIIKSVGGQRLPEC